MARTVEDALFAGTPVVVSSPSPARNRPTHLLVVLHGHDGDPAEALQIGLGADTEDRWVVAAPRGPIAIGDHAAWLDPDADDPAAEGLSCLRAVIDAIAASIGADPTAVVAGFSQGGTMALASALDRRALRRLAGAACLSGGLPDDLDVEWEALAGLPVLVVAGDDDDVVPPVAGRSAAKVLERHGLDVRLVELPIGHHVAPESLHALRAWLEQFTSGGA